MSETSPQVSSGAAAGQRAGPGSTSSRGSALWLVFQDRGQSRQDVRRRGGGRGSAPPRSDDQLDAGGEDLGLAFLVAGVDEAAEMPAQAHDVGIA